jgi:hypothetical protein
MKSDELEMLAQQEHDFDRAMSLLLQSHDARIEEEEAEMALSNDDLTKDKRTLPQESGGLQENPDDGRYPGSPGYENHALDEDVVHQDSMLTPSSQRTTAAREEKLLSPGRQVMKELRESKIERERMARAEEPMPEY